MRFGGALRSMSLPARCTWGRYIFQHLSFGGLGFEFTNSDFGFRISGFGCRVKAPFAPYPVSLDAPSVLRLVWGFWFSGQGFRSRALGFQGFGVGAGLNIPPFLIFLGVEDEGIRFRGVGVGFTASDFGFRVSGFGSRRHSPHAPPRWVRLAFWGLGCGVGFGDSCFGFRVQHF